MFVRDACPEIKKIVTTLLRVSTSTSNPTATKNTSETDGQENDSHQYEQDQECDGGEVFAVKGKGKGGLKGTCFKCGMRGHKADRC